MATNTCLLLHLHSTINQPIHQPLHSTIQPITPANNQSSANTATHPALSIRTLHYAHSTGFFLLSSLPLPIFLISREDIARARQRDRPHRSSRHSQLTVHTLPQLPLRLQPAACVALPTSTHTCATSPSTAPSTNLRIDQLVTASSVSL